MHCPVITHPAGWKDLNNRWVVRNQIFLSREQMGIAAEMASGVLALAMGCSISGVNGTWKFFPPSSVPEE